MDARLPQEEVKECSVFDTEALSSDVRFDSGSAETLVKKYEAIVLQPQCVKVMNSQCDEVKSTGSDMVM